MHGLNRDAHGDAARPVEGTAPPASPCVGLCGIDATTGLCAGCWRTLDEIAAWGGLDADGKRRVLAAVAARRAESA